MADFLDRYGQTPVPSLSVEAARERTTALVSHQRPAEEVFAIIDMEVPGNPSNRGSVPVPVRIYYPKGAGPLPALLFFHGGGWSTGSIDTHDRPARRLANSTGCVIVSVGYRLAPEHKFPVPVEDCMAAVRWVFSNAEQLGLDSGRIGVLGDSAGGNLAAAVCLESLHAGSSRLALQVLIYPVLDHAFNTGSYRDFGSGYMTGIRGMQWYWENYLRTDGDGQNPLASPLRAPALQGLPPALVYTAECDPLRDEAEAYAIRLLAAGVPTTQRRYSGLIHAFMMLDAAIPDADLLYRDLSRDVGKAFQH
ncbi:MAG: alpha/beta hydrolase [Glutamicibacter sp.]